MDVKSYYRKNIKYNFNKQKQTEILNSYSKEQLETALNIQLTIYREYLFDKVNSRSNNKKMISLISNIISNKNNEDN